MAWSGLDTDCRRIPHTLSDPPSPPPPPHSRLSNRSGLVAGAHLRCDRPRRRLRRGAAAAAGGLGDAGVPIKAPRVAAVRGQSAACCHFSLHIPATTLMSMHLALATPDRRLPFWCVRARVSAGASCPGMQLRSGRMWSPTPRHRGRCRTTAQMASTIWATGTQRTTILARRNVYAAPHVERNTTFHINETISKKIAAPRSVR